MTQRVALMRRRAVSCRQVSKEFGDGESRTPVLRGVDFDARGGEQQRVALARALVHEPRLIVCDEPTSALDARTGYSVMELLTKVAVRSDRAVIVVTHDSRVFEFADRICRMEDGRIVKTEILS